MQSDIKKYRLIENSKQIKVNNFHKIRAYHPKPLLSDYNNGIITRYFTIKVNDGVIIEIDKLQYDLLKSKAKNGIDFNLYEPVSLKWKISGVKKDIYKGNIIVTYGVEDTNKRTVERLAKKYPTLKTYLSNWLEFYLDIS